MGETGVRADVSHHQHVKGCKKQPVERDRRNIRGHNPMA